LRRRIAGARQLTASCVSWLGTRARANAQHGQVGHTSFLVELRKSCRPFDALPLPGSIK